MPVCRAVGAVLLVFALGSGCTCGHAAKNAAPQVDYSALLRALPQAAEARPSALLPESVNLAFASADAKGSYDALMKTPLGRALLEGKAIESAELSTEVEEALSFAHDVAATSEQPMLATKLAEALAGPTALGFVVSPQGAWHFVAAKGVDPSQESVVRLAVMVAQVKGKETSSVDAGGTKLVRVERSGRTLFLAPFQNVVLASDDLELAKVAVQLALGKGSASLEKKAADFQAEAATLAGPQVLVFDRFDKGGFAPTLLGLSQGVARVEIGETPVVKLRGTLAASISTAVSHGQAYVPREALLYAGLGALDLDALASRLGQAEKGEPKRVEEQLSLPDDVRQAFTGEGFYALASVEQSHFHHLAGLGVRDSAAVKRRLPELVKAWGGPTARPLEGVADASCTEGGHLCLALVKDYLLYADAPETLKLAVQTALGSHPALTDRKGFGKVTEGGQRYLALYLDTPGAADAALAFFHATAKSGHQSFDEADVVDALEPLCAALKKLPGLGGGANASGTAVQGELRPLD